VFTEAEIEVLDALIYAWDVFVQLPVSHPYEQQEFMHAIHAAQNILFARVGMRVYTAIEEEKSQEGGRE